MEEFLRSWSYLGIFVGILLTGAGAPMPEELPVVIAGALAGGDKAYWWIMLPVCIVAVILGDGLLYFIGRRWGRRLLHNHWVQKWLSPTRVEKFGKAFHDNGIRILLLARLTPGIRTPIFFTAGLTKLPLARFVIADAIYAVPCVSILFWLGYWFTDQMVNFVKEEAKDVKPFILIGVVLLGGGYLFWYMRRKMVPVEIAKDPLPDPVPPGNGQDGHEPPSATSSEPSASAPSSADQSP